MIATEEIRPEYLTYEQARHYSGLSRQTLWREVKAGTVQAFKVGSSVRISRKSLEDFVEGVPFTSQ